MINVLSLPNELDGALTLETFRQINSRTITSADSTYVNILSQHETVRIESEDEWKKKADCKDYPGLMDEPGFGEGKNAYTEREELAKRMCGACAVRSECLNYAIVNKELYHIWGGLTAKERKNLPKQIPVL